MLTSYAQNFEDVYIHRAFRDLEEGFYVDIGAYDATEASVTRFFYDRGWSGINIEPGPSFARLAAQRPRDLNLQLLVADRNGEADFFHYADAPGLSSMTPVPDTVGVPLGELTTSRLPCLSLDEIVRAHVRGRHVHFLKIDVEGAEAAIVNAADWRSFRPELLLIEATYPMTTRRRDEAWSGTLLRNGYHEMFFDGINLYFLREESLGRRGAFAFPANALDGFQKYLPREEILARAAAFLVDGTVPAEAAGVAGPQKPDRAAAARSRPASRWMRLRGFLRQGPRRGGPGRDRG